MTPPELTELRKQLTELMDTSLVQPSKKNCGSQTKCPVKAIVLGFINVVMTDHSNKKLEFEVILSVKKIRIW